MAMDRGETEACLRILWAVAAADGRIEQDELVAMEAVAGEPGGTRDDLPTASRALGAIDVEREAKRLRSPDARRAVLEGALALASVDGRCTAEEHGVLVRLGAALGVPASAIAEAEEGFLARMAEVRDDLATANDEFLRALAREHRQGEVAPRRYEQLLDELRRARRGVLERVITQPR